MERDQADTRLLLRRRDVARDLGISESLLMRWQREGFIKPVRVPGTRAVRYTITEVLSVAARIQNGSLKRDPSEAA